MTITFIIIVVLLAIKLIVLNLLALSPMEIQKFFAPIIKLAEHLVIIYNAKQHQRINEPPIFTVSD